MQPTEFAKWAEDEFTIPFRPYLPLATTIHQLLFHIRNGKMFIGTYHQPDDGERLYEGMMAAFERHVGSRLGPQSATYWSKHWRQDATL